VLLSLVGPAPIDVGKPQGQPAVQQAKPTDGAPTANVDRPNPRATEAFTEA